jgi:hypothetical protein
MKFGTEVIIFKWSSNNFNPIAWIVLKILRFKFVRWALLSSGFRLCSMVTMATKLFTVYLCRESKQISTSTVYMLCCSVSIEAFATGWSLFQRTHSPSLIRFKKQKTTSKNVDRRSKPKEEEQKRGEKRWNALKKQCEHKQILAIRQHY